MLQIEIMPSNKMITRGFAALTLLAALAAQPAGSAMAGEPLTSKERLSDKASDNQRVDNCRVATERRGSMPRPSCPEEGASATGRPGANPSERR